jgi:hypothetical protein
MGPVGKMGSSEADAAGGAVPDGAALDVVGAIGADDAGDGAMAGGDGAAVLGNSGGVLAHPASTNNSAR